MAAIKIITPPTCEPLSRNRLKIQLRMELNYDAENDYLDELISAARERAEALTNRCLITQTVREYSNHFSGPHFGSYLVDLEYRRSFGSHYGHKWELMRSPVQSISAIGYMAINGAEQTLDPTLYNADLVLEPASLYPAPRTCWPITQCGIPNAAWVEYVVGYSDDDSKVPATLKNAIALMAAHWYTNREPIQDIPMSEIPMAATSLLNLNRVYYQP